MIATLAFQRPDDDLEFRDALNGGAWRQAMTELDDFLRSEIKYQGKKFDPVRAKLHDLLAEHSLKLHE